MNPHPVFDAIDTQDGLDATLKALAERLGVPMAQPQPRSHDVIDTVIRRFAWIAVLAFVVGFVIPAARQMVAQHTAVLVQP